MSFPAGERGKRKSHLITEKAVLGTADLCGKKPHRTVAAVRMGIVQKCVFSGV